MPEGFKATKEKAKNKKEILLEEFKNKEKNKITLEDIYNLQLEIFALLTKEK